MMAKCKIDLMAMQVSINMYSRLWQKVQPSALKPLTVKLYYTMPDNTRTQNLLLKEHVCECCRIHALDERLVAR